MITPDDLRLAQRRVRGVALRTPLVPCPRGEEGRLLYLKAENLQPTGAFKLRGAYNKISSLSPEERRRGVIAHSSGNHAQAVAYAASALGVRAVIVMPRGGPRASRPTPRLPSEPKSCSLATTAPRGCGEPRSWPPSTATSPCHPTTTRP
jgi:threonine dehydratase